MEPRNTNKRILRMKDLPFKTGFQPSTLYEFIANGKFPAPFKLVPGGRAAGWFETTIDEWLATQAQQHEIIDSQ